MTKAERERIRAYAGRIARAAALVVDVGWVNGLAAIRSLGRAGVPVLALDHRPSALGFRSRYALPVLCPHAGESEARFVEFLSELGDVLERPAPVFATHDEGLYAIARSRDVLVDRFRYPFPAAPRFAAIETKRAQLERAEALGIGTPRTAYPGSAAEARAAAEELGFPVLVKPSRPEVFKHVHRGRHAFRCSSRDELERAYATTAAFDPMIQEVVPGGDDALYSLGSYVAADGEPLGVFSGRKLRQTPPQIGTCRVGEAVWVQEVVDSGLRLLRALEFNGVSQVEFKRDPRDGRFKLMEVNPRLWQWHGLAAACGVDLPVIAYADLVGENVRSARMDGEGKRWAISLLPGEPPVLPRPPYVDAVFARDDVKPGLVQVARLVRSMVP